MKRIASLYILLFLSLTACEKDPWYLDIPTYLHGEIEKTWHLDSTSYLGNLQDMRATLPCISDDKYVIRYDHTYTYFNDQTSYIEGLGCKDTVIFDILLWEIRDDSILVMNDIPYEVYSVDENHLLLRKLNTSLRKEVNADSLLYDYSYFSNRE